MNGNCEHNELDILPIPHKVLPFSCSAPAVPPIVMTPTDQLRELHTILRDKCTSRNDFIFSADRLIRLVVEEGLNQLPCEPCTVLTPTGQPYDGVRFSKGNCGVSVMRSGEAMERGLRDCCRSIRIGKILIASHDNDADQHVVYAKLPSRVHTRHVMLMYPILHTGDKVMKAIDVLHSYGVPDQNIILLSLFATPSSVARIAGAHPSITMLTSEIHANVPVNFGQRYFGTQDT